MICNDMPNSEVTVSEIASSFDSELNAESNESTYSHSVPFTSTSENPNLTLFSCALLLEKSGDNKLPSLTEMEETREKRNDERAHPYNVLLEYFPSSKWKSRVRLKRDYIGS